MPKPPRPLNQKLLVLLGGLLIWPLVLPLDGLWLAARLPWCQWLTTVATWGYYVLVYRAANPRLRHAMVSGLFIATAGEVFFSLLVGMYEYRLGNVPLYVPPGHTILYATIFFASREPWVRRYESGVAVTLYVVAGLFSGVWLAGHNDVYGWLCFAVFSGLLVLNPASRVFLLGMYLLVGYLELIGTNLGCWYWHPVLLNRWDAIPSGNPPSGIAAFYVGLDLLCLWAYQWTHPRLTRRYERMRRPLSATPTHPISSAIRAASRNAIRVLPALPRIGGTGRAQNRTPIARSR